MVVLSLICTPLNEDFCLGTCLSLITERRQQTHPLHTPQFAVALGAELCAAPWTHRESSASHGNTRLAKTGLRVAGSVSCQRCASLTLEILHLGTKSPVFLYALETYLKPAWKSWGHLPVQSSSGHWQVMTLCSKFRPMLFVQCGIDPCYIYLERIYMIALFSSLWLKEQTTWRKHEAILFFFLANAWPTRKHIGWIYRMHLGNTKQFAKTVEMSLYLGCNFWGCIQVQAHSNHSISLFTASAEQCSKRVCRLPTYPRERDCWELCGFFGLYLLVWGFIVCLFVWGFLGLLFCLVGFCFVVVIIDFFFPYSHILCLSCFIVYPHDYGRISAASI